MSKRILIIAPSVTSSIGGIQNYCRSVRNALINLGYETTTISKLESNDNTDSNNPIVGLSSHKGFLSSLLLIYKSLILAKQKNYTAIFIMHINFSPISLLLRLVNKAPQYLFLYGVEAWNIKSIIKKLALKKVNTLISISQYTKQQLPKKLHTAAKILACTYDENSFYPTQKSEELLKRYQLTENHKILLSVSRLEKSESYKGIEQVLNSLPVLLNQVPQLHYLVIGTGNQQPELQQLTHSLKLDQHVSFLGQIPKDEINQHYNLCDLFILPSTGEGFGIVFLEAMACGKPVLGYSAGGTVDALQNGELGYLVEANNQQELQNQIQQILTSQQNQPRTNPNWLTQQVKHHFGLSTFQTNLHKLVQPNSNNR